MDIRGFVLSSAEVLRLLYFGRCWAVLSSRRYVWLDIWTGSCKPLAATLQVGHLGCAGQVYGVVAKQECGKVLTQQYMLPWRLQLQLCFHFYNKNPSKFLFLFNALNFDAAVLHDCNDLLLNGNGELISKQECYEKMPSANSFLVVCLTL